MHKLYEKVLELYHRLRDGAEGQTMIEYAIILVIVALFAAGILASGVAGGISSAFTGVIAYL